MKRDSFIDKSKKTEKNKVDDGFDHFPDYLPGLIIRYNKNHYAISHLGYEIGGNGYIDLQIQATQTNTNIHNNVVLMDGNRDVIYHGNQYRITRIEEERGYNARLNINLLFSVQGGPEQPTQLMGPIETQPPLRFR